ncbi:hypothetical protein ACIGBL_18880 [Streptomyces sp. NPDC085614]|uniref:hypothetical protein n=1 Tax=Streptomyces sp. NPDC085614 TaxID=3365733 RepID=UPI0037D6C611
MTTSAEAGRAATMRGRRGPGLLLPLGDAEDGAWLTESAARAVLLRAAGRVPGVVPGALRVNLLETEGGTEGGAAPEPPLPVPPGGLPPGPLRVTAEFAAAGDRPLPGVSDELRAALFAAAATELGIRAVRVDLRVTELLDGGAPAPVAPESPTPPGPTSPGVTDPLAAVVRAVAGVAGLTDVVGPPVDRAPGRLRVEVAVTAGRRPLDVARAVRATVTAVAPEGTAVTVLVSDLR